MNDDGLFNGRSVPTQSIAIIVEKSRVQAIQESLAVYQADLRATSISSEIFAWDSAPGATTPNTAEALKTFIVGINQRRAINGVFLIGDLPSAWYEMTAFGKQEKFPVDLFFMDLQAGWQDADKNGIYDSHDALKTQIFSSRLTGSNQEICDYFVKNHTYRSGAMALPREALIFKDDDWRTFSPGSSFGLSLLYEKINYREQLSQTTKAAYLQEVRGPGYEFVNQWIHAVPDTLYVAEGTGYEQVGTTDISSPTPPIRARFYNLYDCSVARYTEDNLAMTYITQTPYGLAAMGSTKVGGAYYSYPFYASLSRGNTWGESFRVWYNSFGYKQDEWFLGMMVEGDPTLTLRKPSEAPAYRLVDTTLSPEPDQSGLKALGTSFENFFAVDKR